MSRRAGTVLAAFALAVCAFAGGCQSPSSFASILAHHEAAGDAKTAAKAPAVVIAPGMEIEWHIKTAHDKPNAIHSDRSVVGPDGTIVLGPYGSCKVGGMTPAQARIAIEKHLSAYLRGPSVAVATQVPPPANGEVAWRPASPGTLLVQGPPTAGKGRPAVTAAALQVPKDNSDGKEKEKEKGNGPEQIPAPRPLVAPEADVPPHVVAPLPPPSPLAAPNECKRILLPSYVIGPTDVLQIESLKGLATQRVLGPHLVGPDGTVRVGIYGPVVVAGMTVEQAKLAIAQAVHAKLDPETVKFKEVIEGLSVDVLAYNSKVYYVIADGGGQGDQVISLPVTGNDTVLDAFAKINGLPLIASKHKIWVARKNCPGCPETILPVDWVGISQRGDGTTNWQLMPGDRLYVRADPWYAADRHLAKILSPIERLFGATLLGSQTVNSIRNSSGSNGTR